MNYGIKDSKQQIGWMQAIGDAGSATGLSGADLTAIATYLGRMSSTDKASLEYLNPLMERNIHVLDYLLEDMQRENPDATKADVYKAISDGAYSGEEVATLIIEKRAHRACGRKSTTCPAKPARRWRKCTG